MNKIAAADNKRHVGNGDIVDILDNATIERCAQVADEYAQIYSHPETSKAIAAAIRALKDA